MDQQQAEKPLISVGMPIFNEARFLRETLEAIVNQDYPNIELIISDNASTDATGQICREYAEKYDWICYHRFKTNEGPAKNFDYVLKSATGKYFMWAAGHDLWSANYLSACVDMLESHPKAMIAYGGSNWINDHGEPFGREFGWIDTRGMDVIARYFAVLWGNMHPILGVIRTDALRACPIINTVGTDLIILSHLVLQGDFVHAVEASWSRREFRTENSYQDKLKRYKNKDYGLASTLLNRLFPLARLPIELAKAVIHTKQPLFVRLLILFLLLPSFPVRYIAGKRHNKLAQD